jgi:parallel beta-helix repeat protein
MNHGHKLLIATLVAVAAVVALALVGPGRQSSLAADGIIYVDADAAGINNGTSWENAFTQLEPALYVATTGDEIWVAAGTYTPTVERGGTGSRYKSFQMKNGVTLYGGFDPSAGDIALEDRDWLANPVILSGDIGTEAVRSDNSYHVFYHPAGTNLNSSAILDGFTITGGNADGLAWPHWDAGGMFNDGSSPMLVNCTFSANSATYSGGRMLNGNSSSPVLINCTFEGNWTDSDLGGGGGMNNTSNSSPTLVNCAFTGNSAEYSWGGGMYNSYSSSPTLTNCTIVANSATSGGGMANYTSSSPRVINSVLWGDSPQEISNNDAISSPVVTYSDIQGGYSGVGNIDLDPLFVDAAHGDLHLGATSPCIDAGDNDALHLPTYDFEGDGRALDGDGNLTRIVDMGVDEVAVDWPYFRVYVPVVLRGY